MALLVAGLVLFLGAHSLRIVAPAWRDAQLARMGEKPWKGLIALVSLAGFAMIVWGYGQARLDPVIVYQPPVWGRHLAALLTIPAFVLVAAAYVPGNRMKRALGHPMVAGTKTWAFAHLLANGGLHDLVLFGSFLAWAVVDYVAARRRDRAAGVTYPPGTAAGDAKTIVIGLVAWALFAFWLHGLLIGVRPFG